MGMCGEISKKKNLKKLNVYIYIIPTPPSHIYIYKDYGVYKIGIYRYKENVKYTIFPVPSL